MQDWLRISDIAGVDRKTTILEIVPEHLPLSIATLSPEEEIRIVYPAADCSGIFLISIHRDGSQRLVSYLFAVTDVGKKAQSPLISLSTEGNVLLENTFKILQSFLTGEHYRIRTDTRDILLKIYPIVSKNVSLDKALCELKVQVAIDLL